MSNYLVSWIDFGTRVPAQNSTFWLESKHYSGVCQKRHYRYPIVAFSINAAIGTKKTLL